MQSGCAALAVAVAVFCPGAVAKEPLTLFGLAIPERVNGLPHTDPYDYEKTNPGLGHSVEYTRPGWKINVYIYDLRMTSIPDDPRSDAIVRQLAQAKGDILALEKRGDYQNVVSRSEYAIADGSGRTRFLCSSFSYFHKQIAATVDSYLCLTLWKNKFVKFRLTTGMRASSEMDARKFVEAWIGVLWPS